MVLRKEMIDSLGNTIVSLRKKIADTAINHEAEVKIKDGRVAALMAELKKLDGSDKTTLQLRNQLSELRSDHEADTISLKMKDEEIRVLRAQMTGVRKSLEVEIAIKDRELDELKNLKECDSPVGSVGAVGNERKPEAAPFVGRSIWALGDTSLTLFNEVRYFVFS